MIGYLFCYNMGVTNREGRTWYVHFYDVTVNMKFVVLSAYVIIDYGPQGWMFPIVISDINNDNRRIVHGSSYVILTQCRSWDTIQFLKAFPQSLFDFLLLLKLNQKEQRMRKIKKKI